MLEHGKTPGIVVNLIVTSDEQQSFNVSEPGVMIKSLPFGLVFWPLSFFEQDPIVFVRRDESRR